MTGSRRMRSVLCYGDSNTFGASTTGDPDGRYAPDNRWTGVLRKALDNEWLLIEEGLGGRTTTSDDPVEGADKNGRTYLRPCLMSHRPLDLVIIMLGTNDLKKYFNKSSAEIADGIGLLIDDINQLQPGHNGEVPKILVVSPAAILENADMWSGLFDGGHKKSQQFAAEFERIANARGVYFFDAGSVVQSSEVDAIHLDPSAHSLLGTALAATIKTMEWA